MEAARGESTASAEESEVFNIPTFTGRVEGTVIPDIGEDGAWECVAYAPETELPALECWSVDPSTGRKQEDTRKWVWRANLPDRAELMLKLFPFMEYIAFSSTGSGTSASMSQVTYLYKRDLSKQSTYCHLVKCRRSYYAKDYDKAVQDIMENRRKEVGDIHV
jgi:hypothetical protein